MAPLITLHYDGTRWNRDSTAGGKKIWGSSGNDVSSTPSASSTTGPLSLHLRLLGHRAYPASSSIVLLCPRAHRARGNVIPAPGEVIEAGWRVVPARGAYRSTEWRLSRVLNGLASFFSGMSFDGILPLVLLGWWLTLHGVRGLGQVMLRRRARPEGVRGGEEPSALGAQVALLSFLWALHFLYFEPDAYESWTLAAALALLAAAAQLPRDRRAWIGMVLPVNVRHYRWNHRADVMAPFLRTVVRASRPNDLVLLEGGRQDGTILRGSLWMRYFLAYERQRSVVSLFDVTGLTETEYWGRPFPTVDSLQAAINSGRRAYSSLFMVQELKLHRVAGLLDVTWSAHSDSVIEITRVKEIPFDPAAPGRVVVLPKDSPWLDRSSQMALFPHRKPPATRTAGSAH